MVCCSSHRTLMIRTLQREVRHSSGGASSGCHDPSPPEKHINGTQTVFKKQSVILIWS